MKRVMRPGGKKKIVFLVALLAVLCVGGSELFASYFFAPAVYWQVTAPVRWAWHKAADFGSQAIAAAADLGNQTLIAAADAAAQLSAMWDSAPPPEEDEQIASEPTLLDTVPVTDPAITELRLENGKEILTGGVLPIVYYNQGDETWAAQPYGSDNIGGYGCGPTAMCMVVSSMTEEDSDPLQMAQWASAHGYWAKGSGSYHSIVEGTAQAYGLTASSISERTPEAIQNELLEGHLLVALMGPGHFTRGGHFIVLRGITLTGSVLVADPNSEERSLTEWDPQLILDELSTRSSSGGPLWVIGYE